MSSIHYTAQKVASTVTGKVGEEEKQEREQVSNLMRDLNQNSEIIRTHNYVLTKPLPNTFKNDTTWKNVLKKAHEINKKEKELNSKISETLNNGTVQSVTLAIRLVLNSEQTTSEEKKAAFELYGKHVKPNLAEQEHINNISELMSELNLNEILIKKYNGVLILPHNLINDSTWKNILKKANEINKKEKNSTKISKTLNDGTVQTVTLAIRLVLNSEQTTHKEKEEALDLFNKIRPELQKGKIENLPLPFPPIEMVGTSTAHEKEVTQTKTETEIPIQTQYYHDKDERAVLNKINLSKYESEIDDIINNVEEDLTFVSKDVLKRKIKLTLLELEYIDEEGDLSKMYLASLRKMSLNDDSLGIYYAKICKYTEPIYSSDKEDSYNLGGDIYLKGRIYKDLKSIIKNISDSILLSDDATGIKGGDSYLKLSEGTLEMKESKEPPGQLRRKPISSEQELESEGDTSRISRSPLKSIFTYYSRNLPSTFSLPRPTYREHTGAGAYDYIPALQSQLFSYSPLNIVEETKQFYSEGLNPQGFKPNITSRSKYFEGIGTEAAIEHASPSADKYVFSPDEFGLIFGGSGERENVPGKYKGDKDNYVTRNLLLSGNLHLIGDEAKIRLRNLIEEPSKIPSNIWLDGEKYELSKDKNGNIIYDKENYPLYIKETKETKKVSINIAELLNAGGVDKNSEKIIIKDFVEIKDYFDEASKIRADLGGRKDFETPRSTYSEESWAHTAKVEAVQVGSYRLEEAGYGFVLHEDSYSTKEKEYYAKYLSHWANGSNFRDDQFLVIKGYETDEGEVATFKTFYKDKNGIYEVRGADNSFIKQLTHAVVEMHAIGLGQLQVNLQANPNTEKTNFFERLVNDPTGGFFISLNLSKDSGLLIHEQSRKPLMKTKVDEDGNKKYSEDTLYEFTFATIIKRNHKIELIGNFFDPEGSKQLMGSGGFKYTYEAHKDRVSVTVVGGESSAPIFNKDNIKVEDKKSTDVVVKVKGTHRRGSNIISWHGGYETGVYDYDNYLNTQDSEKAFYRALHRAFIGGGYQRKTEKGEIYNVDGIVGLPFKDGEFEQKLLAFKFMFAYMNAERNGFKVTLGKHGAMNEMLRSFSQIVRDVSNDKITDAVVNKKIDDFMDRYGSVFNQLWHGSLDIIVEKAVYVSSNVGWIQEQESPEYAGIDTLFRLPGNHYIGAGLDFLSHYTYPGAGILYSDPYDLMTVYATGGKFDVWKLDFGFGIVLKEDSEKVKTPSYLYSGRLMGHVSDFYGHIGLIYAPRFHTSGGKKSDFYIGEAGLLWDGDRFKLSSAGRVVFKGSEYSSSDFALGFEANITPSLVFGGNALIANTSYTTPSETHGRITSWQADISLTYNEYLKMYATTSGGPFIDYRNPLPLDYIHNPSNISPFYFGLGVDIDIEGIRKRRKNK